MTKHKCPFCGVNDPDCGQDDCPLKYDISCDSCYDKGLIEE